MAEPLWSEDSARKQELRKWDIPKNAPVLNSDGTPVLNPDGTRAMGKRCVGYEAFPRMLYKARENPISGKPEVHMTRDIVSADRTTVLLKAEEFNTSCQLTVNDQGEYDRAHALGWRESPQAAMEYHEGTETEKLVAAAVRAHDDRNMSDKAKAESARYEASTPGQVAEVPTSDKRRESLAKAREAKAAKKAASVA